MPPSLLDPLRSKLLAACEIAWRWFAALDEPRGARAHRVILHAIAIVDMHDAKLDNLAAVTTFGAHR